MAETLDLSIESDKREDPFLKGVPAILEGLRRSDIKCRRRRRVLGLGRTDPGTRAPGRKRSCGGHLTQ